MKIEGRNAVREALINNATISKIIASNNSNDKVFQDIIDLAKSKKIKIQFVDKDVLNKESITSHHQGLVAVTEEFKYCELDDIIKYANDNNVPPYILVLDGIEDPHNFGSIIRVCECMGVSGIVIGKNRCCSVNETVVKTSAGATEYMRIAKVTNIHDAIKYLKEQNIWVYACELGGSDLTKTNLTGSVAIVIGSEGFGVGDLTKKLCDGIVTIPMYGKVNSLNASVATGMVLYEVTKQRHNGK